MENPSYFALKNVLTEAATIELGKYTKASYELLQTTIDECMVILTNDISQELSNEYINKINSAVSMLVEIQPLSIEGISISLQDDFAVNIKVNSELLVNNEYTDPYVVFNFDGIKTTISDYSLDNNLYSFTYDDIAATQMNNTLYGTLYAKYNGVEYASTAITLTIREYCEMILADDNYSDCHALVKEMLNYGAMAQMYFDYDTEYLSNDGITGVANAEIPETADKMVVSDKISGLSFYGASLVYRDRIGVRYYFAGDVTGCTFTANGNIYTPTQKDGMYYVEIADILPQNLDQKITLTVTDASGNTLSVAYGPMNYIVRMNQKGSDTLKALVKALYNYHLAAKALSA